MAFKLIKTLKKGRLHVNAHIWRERKREGKGDR